MSAHMTPSNSIYFTDAMSDFFDWAGRDMKNSDVLHAAAALISVSETRLDAFTWTQTFQVHTWALLSSVQRDLGSDDSFVFSKACYRVVDLAIEKEVFPPPVHPEDEPPPPQGLRDVSRTDGLVSVKEEGRISSELRRERIGAVLTCMRVAFKPYRRAAWAKQPVEKLFTEVSRKRLQIDEDQRNELDELTSMLTLMQRKITCGGTQHNIRTYDSTAHPLTTKKVGILR